MSIEFFSQFCTNFLKPHTVIGILKLFACLATDFSIILKQIKISAKYFNIFLVSKTSLSNTSNHSCQSANHPVIRPHKLYNIYIWPALSMSSLSRGNGYLSYKLVRLYYISCQHCDIKNPEI